MDETGLAIMLFGVATIFCTVYAVYQSVNLIKYKDRINYTKAFIIDTVTVVPETMKIRNSRWAYVRLWVDGKQYTSSERIQVSMNTSVGDEIEVAYFKDDPNRIFIPNWKRVSIFSAIGILCLAIMVYKIKTL